MLKGFFLERLRECFQWFKESNMERICCELRRRKFDKERNRLLPNGTPILVDEWSIQNHIEEYLAS